MKDGGPAFPRSVGEDRKDGDQPDGNRTIDAQAGMSLRDYFAAVALQGMLANPELMQYVTAKAKEDETFFGKLAEKAYKLGREMLAERERKDGA